MLRAHTITRRTIEYREEAEPELTRAQALVRVHHVALCGTDLHIWDDDYPTELPLVQGHEFVGRIEAIDTDFEAPGPPDRRSRRGSQSHGVLQRMRPLPGRAPQRLRIDLLPGLL